MSKIPVEEGSSNTEPASQPRLPQMRAGHREDGRVFLEPLGKIGSDFTLEVSQEPDQCQA